VTSHRQEKGQDGKRVDRLNKVEMEAKSTQYKLTSLENIIQEQATQQRRDAKKYRRQQARLDEQQKRQEERQEEILKLMKATASGHHDKQHNRRQRHNTTTESVDPDGDHLDETAPEDGDTDQDETYTPPSRRRGTPTHRRPTADRRTRSHRDTHPHPVPTPQELKRTGAVTDYIQQQLAAEAMRPQPTEGKSAIFTDIFAKKLIAKPYMYMEREGVSTLRQKLDKRVVMDPMEYITCLVTLIRDGRAEHSEVDRECMLRHLQQVTSDAMVRPWKQVRRWSQLVFDNIERGEYEWIDDNRIEAERIRIALTPAGVGPQGGIGVMGAASARKHVYCRDYNLPQGCRMRSPHEEGALRKHHNCAYCEARGKHLLHSIQNCQNKRRDEERAMSRGPQQHYTYEPGQTDHTASNHHRGRVEHATYYTHSKKLGFGVGYGLSTPRHSVHSNNKRMCCPPGHDDGHAPLHYVTESSAHRHIDPQARQLGLAASERAEMGRGIANVSPHDTTVNGSRRVLGSGGWVRTHTQQRPTHGITQQRGVTKKEESGGVQRDSPSLHGRRETASGLAHNQGCAHPATAGHPPAGIHKAASTLNDNADTGMAETFNKIKRMCALNIVDTEVDITAQAFRHHRERYWPHMSDNVKDSNLVRIYEAVRATGLPNCMGARLVLPTELNLDS
jgi:hypothetical protein